MFIAFLLRTFAKSLNSPTVANGSERFERFESVISSHSKRFDVPLGSASDDETLFELVKLEPVLELYIKSIVWLMVKEIYVVNERVRWMLDRGDRYAHTKLPTAIERFIDSANLRRSRPFAECLKSIFQQNFLHQLKTASKPYLFRTIRSIDEQFDMAVHTYPHSSYWLEERR
ncbi:ORF125 [Leucania separata nucleopolyhedrovirus]|uniref:ORF125 n=1 Tax=Leucania separata nucleopolyhedrovirus TaxID=1307956 RepID=Q0IKZ4_NPVLS|nr:ORF125 [Leucania separata nucleopolyhedrovirus]AAR28889.1 ORF125 [Leucania separata nucleopolyhedrovirus]